MHVFSDIKVIDLTHVVAGPFCTYQLAVLGADVIKVEAVNAPDMVRATGHAFPAGEAGLGAYYTAQSANKRSIALDLKTAAGRNILRRLLEDADVLVENYRSGAMAELELAYPDVCSIKADIIYCSITGFGQTGPLAQRTAYDNVIQAYSGLMAATGEEHRQPVQVGPPVLDYGTGIQAAFAIAAALYHRAKTGVGQYIDVAMLDAAMMLMSCDISYYQQHQELVPRTGNSSPYNAGYACYACKRDLLMLGAYTGQQVKNMWRVLGDPQYGESLKALTPPAMRDLVARDAPKIASLLKAKTAEQWEQEFNQHRVPAARVRKLDETLRDPQLQQRAVLQAIPGAPNDGPYPTAAFVYEHSGAELKSPPPMFAQHTREILLEAGFESAEIDALIAQQVAR